MSGLLGNGAGRGPRLTMSGGMWTKLNSNPLDSPSCRICLLFCLFCSPDVGLFSAPDCETGHSIAVGIVPKCLDARLLGGMIVRRKWKSRIFWLSCVVLGGLPHPVVFADSSRSYRLRSPQVSLLETRPADQDIQGVAAEVSVNDDLVRNLISTTGSSQAAPTSSRLTPDSLTDSIDHSFSLPKVSSESIPASNDLALRIEESLMNVPRAERGFADRPWMMPNRLVYSKPSTLLEALDPKAVPEPASLLLLLTGWLGLVARRRLRRSIAS